MREVESNTGGAPAGAGAMRKRRTTMEDGRYLIYYTFGEGEGGAAESADGVVAREPRALPEAEDERSV